MTYRRRAEAVRIKLIEIMSREEFLNASTQDGISRTAVEALKKEAPELVTEHSEELTDIGLMHTAGSTKSTAMFAPSNDNTSRQLPLFFTILPAKPDERARPARTSEVTPEDFFRTEEIKSERLQQRRQNHARPNTQNLREIAEEMRDKGLQNMTFGEYLASK